MKSMIRLFGFLVLAAVIGLPLLAQAPPPNVDVRVIQAQANNVNNLLHRNLSAGEKHFYRVNGLSGPFYYVFWRDSDHSDNISSPHADVKVSVVNLTTNRVLASNVDIDRSMSEERLINAIEITRGVHFTAGHDILIIVEGFNSSSSGNYAILVY